MECCPLGACSHVGRMRIPGPLHLQKPTGDTPLIAACKKGGIQMLQLLIDRGASRTLDIPNVRGRTHTRSPTFSQKVLRPPGLPSVPCVGYCVEYSMQHAESLPLVAVVAGSCRTLSGRPCCTHVCVARRTLCLCCWTRVYLPMPFKLT